MFCVLAKATCFSNTMGSVVIKTHLLGGLDRGYTRLREDLISGYCNPSSYIGFDLKFSRATQNCRRHDKAITGEWFL